MSHINKPLVIKVGGAILSDDNALKSLIKVMIELQQQGQEVVLVHGGGASVDALVKAAGFVSEKKQGLRVTPKEQMPIISGTLAGYVNKHIVALSSSLGAKAVGLSLADGNMCPCLLSPLDLGMVGEPTQGDDSLLLALLNTQCLPVISSIGALESGALVNVNADDAAVAVAQLIAGELVFLTDVAGVKGANGELCSELNAEQITHLINEGVIAGGMIAKVNAALVAATKLRRSIAVASWQTPHYLLSFVAQAEADSKSQVDSNARFVGTRILF